MLNHATPGEVIRAINRAKAGGAFIGGTLQANVSAQYPHVQFLNPAASGVTAILSRAFGQSSAVAEVYFNRYDTALTTDVAIGINKSLGGAAPACEIRTQTSGSPLGTILARVRQLADEGFEYLKDEPFVLGAGEGLLLVANVVNIRCQGLFEWTEE